MSKLTFAKAVKTKIRLRAALFGPSGSGKTFTALRIAKGLGGSIAVIDTERGAARKYADRFDFDVLELEAPNIETTLEAIAAAKGHDVLIIDSLSHPWQQLLDEVDRIGANQYRGNNFAAWSKATPKQRRLVDAILGFPGHLLATMRSKTEWGEEKDERTGKHKPVRIGLTPEQGKGIEYEFDILLELNTEHCAKVLKDRTGRFQDRVLELPGEEFGAELGQWLNDGEEAPKPAARPSGDEESAASIFKDIMGAMVRYMGDADAKTIGAMLWKNVKGARNTLSHVRADLANAEASGLTPDDLSRILAGVANTLHESPGNFLELLIQGIEAAKARLVPLASISPHAAPF